MPNISHCASCHNLIRPKDESIACTRAKCDKRYHKDTCIGGAAPRLNELISWLCPQCKFHSKRGGETSETLVKVPAVPNLQSPDMNVTVRSKKGLPEPDFQALTTEIRLLREDVSSFNAKLDNVSSAMSTIREQMDTVVARMACTEERVTELEERYLQETTALKYHIQKLEGQLSTQAQTYLRNEVEFIGVPEYPNENLTHIALVAANKIGVDLGENDIDWVLRAGVSRKPTSSDSTTNFARPVVMRLLRRAKRDEFIKCVKTRKSITTKDLGIDNQAKRVFFNERLTRDNRELFRECRNRAAAAGYKFCWTSSGTIFLRKCEGCPAIRIRSVAELDEKLTACAETTK